MQILAGTSGYSYKEWCGTFYPPKLAAAKMLAYLRDEAPRRRDQQHLLPPAAAEAAGELEGAGAAGLPLRHQGVAADHAHQAYRRRGVGDGASARDDLESRRAAGRRAVPASALHALRPAAPRRLPRSAPGGNVRGLRVPSRLVERRRRAREPRRRTVAQCARATRTKARSRRSRRRRRSCTCACGARATKTLRSAAGSSACMRATGSALTSSSSTRTAPWAAPGGALPRDGWRGSGAGRSRL
jgi:hypothetical protein